MKNCQATKTTVLENATTFAHMHLTYELYFLYDGNRTYFIENEKYELEKNSLICVPPNISHYVEGGYYTRYIIFFSEDFVSPYQIDIIKHIQQQKIIMTNDEASAIQKVLDNLISIQNDKTKTENSKNFKMITCFNYLILLLSCLENFPQNKYNPKNNYSLRTNKIIYYIENNYSKKLTLEKLANSFFVSKMTLCKEFKKDTGTTISDYILKVRLENSIAYLKYTNKTMDKISEICGFSSGAYFYYSFKKFFKITPSQYRKDNKVYERNDI